VKYYFLNKNGNSKAITLLEGSIMGTSRYV